MEQIPAPVRLISKQNLPQVVIKNDSTVHFYMLGDCSQLLSKYKQQFTLGYTYFSILIHDENNSQSLLLAAYFFLLID